MERLRKHIEKELNSGRDETKSKATGHSSVETILFVHLFDFVSADEFEDEDEQAEVVANIKDLLAPFVTIQSLEIINRISLGVATCFVSIGFRSRSEAVSAVEALDRMVFGGVAMRARLADSAEGPVTSTNKGSDSVVSSDSNSGSLKVRGGRTVLHLENLLSSQDVEDEEETEEVLGDLSRLCGTHKGLIKVWVEKRRARDAVVGSGDETTPVTRYLGKKQQSAETKCDSAESSKRIEFVEFTSLLAAVQALKAFGVDGSITNAFLYNYDAYRDGVELSDKHRIDPDSGHVFGVNLLGLVDADSLADEEERAEILRDVEHIVQSPDPSNVIAFVGHSDSTSLDALILCDSLLTAAVRARDLRDKLVSGSRLRVQVVRAARSQISHGQVIADSASIEVIQTADQGGAVVAMCGNGEVSDTTKKINLVSLLSEEDASAVTRVTFRGLLRLSAAEVVHVDEEDCCIVACAEYSSREEALEAVLALDGLLVAGARVMGYLSDSYDETSDKEEQSQPFSGEVSQAVTVPSVSSSDDQVTCLYFEQLGPRDTTEASSSVDVDAALSESVRRLSKFDEAVLAPRLPKHNGPCGAFKLADEDTNALVKEFLLAISSFQVKMKLKNPQRAKQRPRFLAGIKQVTNAIKGGGVKLVLLAPNIEESEVLDSKIDRLLSEAVAREVPVLYCLNKRGLGKAVQMTMKQSVVGVLDANGAFAQFKKILAFISA